MTKHPTIVQQFRSFCVQNNATDIQSAIEYFAVFGGMGWHIDMSKPLDVLIEEKILKNYKYIHADITTITKSNHVQHLLLSALATGDRREHAAFKKANVGRAVGEKSIDFLIDNGLLVLEKSIEKPVEDEEVSDKLLFVQPFMRFWFSCISPYYKGIKAGDYKEVKERWQYMQYGFSDLIYERLVMALLKEYFQKDDFIKSIGSYWDKHVGIDIVAITKSGKMIAGSGKYAKNKTGKSTLTTLKDKCNKAQFDIDTFVIFSKSKFSNELKKEKSASLKLLSPRNLNTLLDNLSEKDLLVNTNKKY